VRWAVLLAVTTVAYLPALQGGFILDDDLLLTGNRLIHAADGLYRIWLTREALDYWPLYNSVLWVQWRLWHLSPTGYHVVNLLFHLGATALIWDILRRLAWPGAWLAAAVFALHPVNVESVAWIAQCKSVLALFFFLLSIRLYLESELTPRSETAAAPRHHRTSVSGWYLLSLLAFVLAMLSKSSVAILPLVLGLLIWDRRTLSWRDGLRLAPFILIAVLLVTVSIWFQRHGTGIEFRHATALERLLGAAAAVWFYLSKALLPLQLTFVYPQWQIDSAALRWWSPLFATIAVSVALLWQRRGRGRPLWLAWAYYGIALIPVLGFTDVSFMEHSLVADHYQHVALVGVAALIGTTWGYWRQAASTTPRRRASTAVAAVGCGVLALLTWQQSGLYVNAETLYVDTLRKNPDSWLVHGNLGGLLFESGRRSEAIEHLETAVRLHADFPDAHLNLCTARRGGGDLNAALVHCETAVRLRAQFPEAHNNLGYVWRELGRADEARQSFAEAVRQRPDYADALNNLGVELARAGRLREGITHLRRAIEVAPGFADAQHNLGIALRQLEKQDTAP